VPESGRLTGIAVAEAGQIRGVSFGIAPVETMVSDAIKFVCAIALNVRLWRNRD
jgi:hypothetical protein